uniref:Peroxisomal ATPase PEX6 n=1 Tax=Ditylenchus dipsaci TaxID=166011 RepID=A0A915ENM2_9BILA
MLGSPLFQNLTMKTIKEIPKDALLIAKKMCVSLIRCPENNFGHNKVKRALFKYFSVERLIYSGDVIAVEKRINENMFFQISIPEASNSSNPYLVSNRTTECVQLPDIAWFYPSTRVNLQSEFIPQSVHQLAFHICSILHPCLAQPMTNSKAVVALIAGCEDGGHLMLNYLSDLLAVNFLQIDCFDFWQGSASGSKVDTKIDGAFEQASSYAPCLLWLRNINTLSSTSPNSVDSAASILDHLTIVMATRSCNTALVLTCETEDLDKIPKKLAKMIHFEFIVDGLKEEDRKAFFDFHSKYLKNLEMGWLLNISRGFSLPEIDQMLEEARLEANQKNRHTVTQEDIEIAISRRNKAIGDVVGVPKVPKVTWDDVGGLEEVKQLISESLQMNLKASSAGKSLRRSGIVLYGPPGCGKTLVAKAVANKFQMSFLSVKGPELLNQYIGQSEKNLRNVFEKARAASPSILFFDELDSLAPNRGVAGDSGGVMDRMVSQLLSEMDSIQWKTDIIVFVMAATNRPDLLDPCLLTPGRFDKAVLVKPADDIESKERILRPICKRLCLEPGLNVHKIACRCPPSISGAELTSLMSKATMHCIREVIYRIEKGSEQEAEDVVVCERHVDMALQEFASTIPPAIHEHNFSKKKHL